MYFLIYQSVQKTYMEPMKMERKEMVSCLWSLQQKDLIDKHRISDR
jgi:hypothetical protein